VIAPIRSLKKTQDGAMFASDSTRTVSTEQKNAIPSAPHIVVGITHPQTCLTLTGHLRALGVVGFRVTLVSSPGELLEKTASKEGARAVALKMERGMAPLADLLSLLRLWRLLRALRPEMTEFSTPKAGLLGGLAARFAGVPARVYMLRGLKLNTAKGLKRRILLSAERLSARCAQVVLCNSESLRSEALALRIAPAAKLKLLGNGSSNGVNLERFSPGASEVRRKLGLRRESPVIGFVGRLTRDKGLPELIEAFEFILQAKPEAHLLLVGWFDASEDALRPALQTRIERHARIHCTGYVDDTAPYYRAMDLLVLPTRREGFPNVVLEAAATGLPVVTTECTGARDSVVPEVTGLLIPPGYPEAIAEAVIRLLHDPACGRRMGAAARAWVAEHYSDTRVLALTVEFYRTLLSESRAMR
jgi:glycosyltransferase involved in cell wall biosynthesis